MRTDPRNAGRSRAIVLGLAGSALVLVAVVVGFFLLSGGSNAKTSDAVSALGDAGCTYSNPKSQGRGHVLDLAPGYKSNSVPRTSGPHANDTIIYGFYTDVVSELNAVHNLEHGAVIIWFGPKVSQDTVEQINEFYLEDPNALIVAKHPQLGDDVALVAWTRMARCQGWNEDAASAFIKSFRGKGPEKFDISDLQPGRG